MPSPTLGTVSFFCAKLVKQAPFMHSSSYRQPDRAGRARVVGPAYSEPSSLMVTKFLVSKLSEKSFLDSCAALCGDFHTFTEYTSVGNEIVHDNVWVAAFRATKSNACVCVEGEYVIEGTFDIELPEDW